MAKSELIVSLSIFDRLTFLYSFAKTHDISIFVKTFCHMTPAAEGPLKMSFNCVIQHGSNDISSLGNQEQTLLVCMSPSSLKKMLKEVAITYFKF